MQVKDIISQAEKWVTILTHPGMVRGLCVVPNFHVLLHLYFHSYSIHFFARYSHCHPCCCSQFSRFLINPLKFTSYYFSRYHYFGTKVPTTTLPYIYPSQFTMLNISCLSPCLIARSISFPLSRDPGIWNT